MRSLIIAIKLTSFVPDIHLLNKMLSKILPKASSVTKAIRTKASKPKVILETKNGQKLKTFKPEDFKIEYGRLF